MLLIFSCSLFKYDIQCFSQRYSSVQRNINVCSAVLEPNICPNVLIHMFWPGAQTGLEKTQCSHRIPKCLKYLTLKHRENTCTNAHICINKQHMCAHTIMLLKQIRSDAFACACQEHAESTLERERERRTGRETVCMYGV